MAYPYNICKMICKAELQNKTNDVTMQLLDFLQNEVIRLEQEEFAFFQPQVQGLKYVQDLLNSLKNKAERYHQAEQLLLKRELLIRDTKSSDYLARSLIQPQAGAVMEGLKAEEEYGLTLNQHVLRMTKLLEGLKKHKQSPAKLMDIVTVQTLLTQKLKTKTKELEDLDKQLKKIGNKEGSGTLPGNKKTTTSSNSKVISGHQQNLQDLADANQELMREIANMKEQLESEFSEKVGHELKNVEDQVGSGLIKLQDLYQEVCIEGTENKKKLSSLVEIEQQKENLIKGEIKTNNEAAERKDSQQEYLAELLQKKSSLQAQLECYNSQVDMVGRVDQNTVVGEEVIRALTFAKKKLCKLGEESIKLYNTKEGFSTKLLTENLLSADLEKQMEYFENGMTVENAEEKCSLKLKAKKLFEDLQTNSEAEKKSKKAKLQRMQQLEDFKKDIKSSQERLEARKAERNKTEKELRCLAAEFENVDGDHDLSTTKDREIDLQQQNELMDDQLKSNNDNLKEALQENEVLRSEVIATAEAMMIN